MTAKNKVGMIDGTVARPPEGDPNRAKWEISNALVISWIFNTLDSKLQSSVACATVAQDLLEDLRERYSQGNETRIYQLKAEIGKLKQDGMTIPRYYSRLKGLWDELDNYLQIPACTCSAAKTYAAQREREKIHQFLMGLGSEYATRTGLGSGQFDGLQAHQAQIGSFNPGPGQFGGLQAHQAQIGQSSLGPNQMGRLQAHQAPSGQLRSGLNRLAHLSDPAFQRLLDFLGPDDDNMHPASGKNFISNRTTRRTIGVGELQGGVYYLRLVAIQEQANRVISEETGDL
ncbi:hypothetical protein CRG98_038861 [Punica granatum]|uniref:Uncharacterized protein n=1 Tax=Punica granatum TaxID=22663 RepID=A0A2I0IAR2_PUNGR|nr:hypothetical protein CRG98_038861 [Punica granatum]